MFQGTDPVGIDLESIDIQKGRDHGLPVYIDVLRLCTGTVVTKFSDLSKYIPEKVSVKVQKVNCSNIAAIF